MTIYKQLSSVDLAVQKCGSMWLMILRGETEEIELAFNGLFNHGATNGRLVYSSRTQDTATFWSNPRKMWQFFFNRENFHRLSKPAAADYANNAMFELEQCGEIFLDFRHVFCQDGLAVGTNKAERPDSDFKDAVLRHSFRDSTSVAQVEKQLASHV